MKRLGLAEIQYIGCIVLAVALLVGMGVAIAHGANVVPMVIMLGIPAFGIWLFSHLILWALRAPE